MKYLTSKIKSFALAAVALAVTAQYAHAVDIVRSNNQWMVKRNDGVLVSCSNNIFRGIEIGVGLLNAGRTSKETIRLIAPAGTYAVSGGPANIRAGTGNFILDLGRDQGVRLNLSGGGVVNIQGRNNFDIRNLDMIGGTTGISLFTKTCSNVIFEDIRIAGSNSAIGIRPEGTWQTNSYVSNITVRGDCSFTGLSAGNHGIETFSVDGFFAPNKVTTNNTGGCGILLNRTRNSNIYHLVATRASYNPASSQNYSAYRLTNGSSQGKTCYMRYLESYTSGRGLSVLTSDPIYRVEVQNVKIDGSANWGIGIAALHNNIYINSGSSNNNAWSGLDVANSRDSTFQNLQIRGNGGPGINIGADSRNLKLRYVDVDGNGQASKYSNASIIDSTGSDLVN